MSKNGDIDLKVGAVVFCVLNREHKKTLHVVIVRGYNKEQEKYEVCKVGSFKRFLIKRDDLYSDVNPIPAIARKMNIKPDMVNIEWISLGTGIIHIHH